MTSQGLAQTTEQEAHRLFQDASDALAEGEFSRAEEMFRQSLQLSPRKSTAFNLADPSGAWES